MSAVLSTPEKQARIAAVRASANQLADAFQDFLTANGVHYEQLDADRREMVASLFKLILPPLCYTMFSQLVDMDGTIEEHNDMLTTLLGLVQTCLAQREVRSYELIQNGEFETSIESTGSFTPSWTRLLTGIMDLSAAAQLKDYPLKRSSPQDSTRPSLLKSSVPNPRRDSAVFVGPASPLFAANYAQPSSGITTQRSLQTLKKEDFLLSITATSVVLWTKSLEALSRINLGHVVSIRDTIAPDLMTTIIEAVSRRYPAVTLPENCEPLDTNNYHQWCPCPVVDWPHKTPAELNLVVYEVMLASVMAPKSQQEAATVIQQLLWDLKLTLVPTDLSDKTYDAEALYANLYAVRELLSHLIKCVAFLSNGKIADLAAAGERSAVNVLWPQIYYHAYRDRQVTFPDPATRRPTGDADSTEKHFKGLASQLQYKVEMYGKGTFRSHGIEMRRILDEAETTVKDSHPYAESDNLSRYQAFLREVLAKLDSKRADLAVEIVRIETVMKITLPRSITKFEIVPRSAYVPGVLRTKVESRSFPPPPAVAARAPYRGPYTGGAAVRPPEAPGFRRYSPKQVFALSALNGAEDQDQDEDLREVPELDVDPRDGFMAGDYGLQDYDDSESDEQDGEPYKLSALDELNPELATDYDGGGINPMLAPLDARDTRGALRSGGAAGGNFHGGPRHTQDPRSGGQANPSTNVWNKAGQPAAGRRELTDFEKTQRFCFAFGNGVCNPKDKDGNPVLCKYSHSIPHLKQSIVRKGEHKAKVNTEEEELKAMLARLEARHGAQAR
jgi:hypothetical protein